MVNVNAEGFVLAHPASCRRVRCSARASEPDARRSPTLARSLRPPRSTPARPSPPRRSEGRCLPTRTRGAGRGLGPAAPRTEWSPAGEVEEERMLFIIFTDHQTRRVCRVWWIYLVVLHAALVLVQRDALPVQHPVMTFPLWKTSEIIYELSVWEVKSFEKINPKGRISKDVFTGCIVKEILLNDWQGWFKAWGVCVCV